MDDRRAGARLAKVNQHVALVGPGAQTQVNGVMFTEGRQHSPTTRCSITKRRTAKAICFTRAACRINRGSSGAA